MSSKESDTEVQNLNMLSKAKVGHLSEDAHRPHVIASGFFCEV